LQRERFSVGGVDESLAAVLGARGLNVFQHGQIFFDKKRLIRDAFEHPRGRKHPRDGTGYNAFS